MVEEYTGGLMGELLRLFGLYGLDGMQVADDIIRTKRKMFPMTYSDDTHI